MRSPGTSKKSIASGTFDRRHDEIHSGQVQPLDGEAFFERLRQQEAELIQER
jgi:hypothetical protein